MRRRFQGLRNVILFNWPYYVFGAGALIILAAANQIFNWPGNTITAVLVTLLLLVVAISLLATLYVYDISGLYELGWLDSIPKFNKGRVVNVTAGFDETSSLLADRFKDCELYVFDFFDQKRHTEPSIRRARAAYPRYPGTRIITTNSIPLENDSADLIVAFLSAHEIRDRIERVLFFKELGRSLSSRGHVLVVEHVRNTANFLAYNVGALHFHTRASWLAAFQSAGLEVKSEVKETPFVTAFTLRKIGN